MSVLESPFFSLPGLTALAGPTKGPVGFVESQDISKGDQAHRSQRKVHRNGSRQGHFSQTASLPRKLPFGSLCDYHLRAYSSNSSSKRERVGTVGLKLLGEDRTGPLHASVSFLLQLAWRNSLRWPLNWQPRSLPFYAFNGKLPIWYAVTRGSWQCRSRLTCSRQRVSFRQTPSLGTTRTAFGFAQITLDGLSLRSNRCSSHQRTSDTKPKGGFSSNPPIFRATERISTSEYRLVN
jgi:hypothetical protein